MIFLSPGVRHPKRPFIVSNITLSGQSFTGGAASGTLVGNGTISGSPGSFIPGGVTVDDTAHFQITNISGNTFQLRTLGVDAAGSYPINITASPPGGSPFARSFTITGSGAVATTSVTFVNKSASASPATTPLTVTQAFKRAAVPSGFIAVPNLSGSPITYQADARTYWDDGSLRLAVFRCLVGAISGGATVQVTFPISAGSYSNTSAFSTASLATGTIVTNESDFKLAFTNVHTASMPNTVNTVDQFGNVGIKISGGSIVSGTGAGVVHYNATLSGTYNITGGGGTGGQVSISGSTATRVAAGSGYANVGSGSFTPSFNTLVSTWVSNGNTNGNGVNLVQYAKGSVCDAWRGRTTVSGLNHFHCTFYVERWKDGSGNFLAFKAYAVYGSGLKDTVNGVPNYTFDLDWKNGSTVIRGATNSDPGFNTLVCYAFGSGSTFRRGTSGISYVDAAKPDWCNNANSVWTSDAVVSAVIQERTSTECIELRATGLISPWLNITPTFATPATSTATAYTVGGGAVSSHGAQDDALAVYEPFGTAGMRCPFGTGGSDLSEAPISGEQAYHWMWLACASRDTAKANIWLVNSRVAAAHGLGHPTTGAGWFDTANVMLPCVVPTSAQTFGTGGSAMVQDKDFHYTQYTVTGSIHPMLNGSNNSAYASIYHQPNYLYYAYLHDGEQWMLDAQYYSGAATTLWMSPGQGRQPTLGATPYYGVYGYRTGGDFCAANTREPAWWMRAVGYADVLMPTTWADGTTCVDQQYADYLTASTPTYLNALISFTGTYSPGSGVTPMTKTVNLTVSGVYPEQAYGQTEDAPPFMDDYEMQTYSHLGYLLRGTSAGTQINNFLTYRKLYYVKMWAYSGSHYLNDSYRINAVATGQIDAGPSDTTWESMGNEVSPGLGVWTTSGAVNGGSPNSPFPSASFTNGSSTVTMTGAMLFQGSSTRIANGSRIKMSVSDIYSANPFAHTLPGGFDGTTWYYWKERTDLDATGKKGELHTNSSLTAPVTATTGVSGISFWVVPSNALPADNSGVGLYMSGATAGGSVYSAFKYGTMRNLAAFERAMTGSVSTDTADAVSNLRTIFQAVNPLSSPNYDNAFGGYNANAYDDAAVIG